MQRIWNIQPSLHPVTLYKGNDPQYWIAEKGELTPIIVNGLFIVVSQEMLFFFERYVPACIVSHPVTIFDRPSNARIEGYYRLYIKHKINVESVEKLDISEMKIWELENSMGGGIFISDALMQELKKSGIDGLTYYQGFSHYG